MWALICKPLLYCYIVLTAPAATTPKARVFHPIHVSTTNINFNSKEKKLEVICTIFTDDFESALTKQYHAKTDLTKQEMHAAMDELVKKYLAANLAVKTGANGVPLTYLGFEINREATDIYLESAEVAPFKSVEADVSLLHNLYDDQINIVHITVNGTRKSEKLDYPNKKITQVF